MVKQIIRNWKTINPWHFVWIGIIVSEILTTLLSVIISLTLWGNVSRQILIVGFFDAFIVSFIVVFITIYFLRRSSSLSEINERLLIEINERKQMEQALVESHNSLQYVVDSIDAVVYVADMQTYEVLLINKYVRDKFGDIKGKICWQTIQKGQTGPCSFCSNSKLIGNDGKLLDTYIWDIQNTFNNRWYECHDKVIKWIDGRIVRIEIAADITERKKSEEALRESEERLKAIFENAKEGILVIDAETRRFINANIMICQMLGYSCEEIKKLGLSDIHPEEDLPFVSEQFEKLARQALATAYKIPIKRKDGTVFYAEINSSPFKLAGKNYMAGFFRDITENNKLEEQLRQSQKIVAVGVLAGGVAHEFSNILTTIKGSAYIIQKKLEKDDSLNKYSEQITASINKASNLAQGLLAFSRKQIVDLKPQNLSEIVMRVKNLVSNLIGEHIELTIEFTGRDLTIIADSNQIEQVLVNLITNAKDAMLQGGRLTIKTDIEEMNDDFNKKHGFGLPGKYALISVSDTGTGMTESIKEKIFEPFFTTKELGKGTGLGLSIVYGIVKQHNGYIDVDTKLNEGTTFKLYIPAVESKGEGASMKDMPSVIGGLETILLAEDEADTREIMSDVLRAEGYTVLEAIDGEDAIRKFSENKERIHLALLDVRMPKKDGKQVYDEIRRIRPNIRCLFISGYTADVIDSDKFSELGLNFISKASTPEEILGKIREVLDKAISSL